MEFYTDTFADAWEQSLVYLLTNGKAVDTQRGMRALELTNVILKITNPIASPISSKYGFGIKFIEEYVKDLENGYKGVSLSDRIYRYGEERINQLEKIVCLLKKDPYSRRAIIDLWLTKQDSESFHPPCPVSFQFYIRDSLLHMTSILRSNDVWMAAIPDMIAFTRLQKEIAEQVGVEIGSYNQLSISYHIYECDIIIAKEIFNL